MLVMIVVGTTCFFRVLRLARTLFDFLFALVTVLLVVLLAVLPCIHLILLPLDARLFLAFFFLRSSPSFLVWLTFWCSWVVFWCSWVPFGLLLGAFGLPFGCLFDLLGGSLGFLGRSVGPRHLLDRFWRRLGSPKGAQHGSPIVLKSIQK